jgi:predicted CopG family antitoxin
MQTHRTIMIRMDDYERLDKLRKSSIGRVSFTEIIHDMIMKLEKEVKE